jgi:predicted transcriptional regulator
MNELIDSSNQITVRDIRGGATVVAARETVGETAAVAARELGYREGDIPTLALDGTAFHPTDAGSRLDDAAEYELVLTGTTP